jgi:predicted transcriptional regulator
MTFVVNLSPELEAQLREKAIRQGQDINTVASELLASILQEEAQDAAEAVKGIQHGLDDFSAGNFRPFNEYAGSAHPTGTQLEQFRQDIQNGIESGDPTPWNAAEIKQAGRQRRAARNSDTLIS